MAEYIRNKCKVSSLMSVCEGGKHFIGLSPDFETKGRKVRSCEYYYLCTSQFGSSLFELYVG
jgi:hypothetical protein